MKILFLIFIGLCLMMSSLYDSKAAFAAATSNVGKKGLLTLGSQAPDFKLKDVVSGKTVTRDGAAGSRGTLVMFICRHCPFVQHVKQELAKIAKEYQPKGLGVVAISANDPAEYAEDAPERLKAMAIEEGFAFPFLFDPTQAVAKSYTAIMTPDIFLFDSSGKLVYRGQVDGSRPGQDKLVDGKDLRAAIENLLEGKPPLGDQKPAIGCSIKWKKGNEPAYAIN
jgi:peroxiredoxin